MSIEVWGLLPKAQDNAQTIDEAISAAISAHESDPEAHLGSGESLETHRANDTLDHPAGSALADKLTMSEVTFGDNFGNLSLYSTVGDVSNPDWPGAQLYVEYGAVNISSIYTPLLLPSPYLTNDHDFLFQVSAQWQGSDINHLDIDLGLGIDNGTTSAGLGFFVHDGVVKGIFGIGANINLTSDLSVDITEAHIYRAQYIASESTAYFFVDGIQKATLALPTGTLGDDGNLNIKAKVTASNDGTLKIDNLFTSRSLI